MLYKRATRVASVLREVLSEILSTQLKDPSVGRITLSRVTVSDDLRHARIYFSMLGNQGDRAGTLEGLNRARGFVRAEIGKRMKLRFLPELEFIYDDSLDRADRINQLLKQVLPAEESKPESEQPKDIEK